MKVCYTIAVESQFSRKQANALEQNRWYLEYKIHNNRPGLLGDIASLLGMLQINILTINGVEDKTRGLLLQTDDIDKIELLEKMLKKIESITLNKLRAPTMLDRLAVRHGRYIERDSDDLKTFRFTRDELGMLVDFLGEIMKSNGNVVIGLRGMPRVGKTESIIAGCVSAKKRWIVLSSTFLRQTVRNQLNDDEWNEHHLYIIDGIMSTVKSSEKHHQLLQDIMNYPAVKVIEHPDIFVRDTEFDYSHFDYLVELRNSPDEDILYDPQEHPLGFL